ncbi:hypothetical protein N7492_001586 [Penicillium capsulatum]|uniref:Uncharacterized protein n=1 Tax=Penicillium capsulatum TaxID=69766 RepID=A0A9W9M004_9EURO|nr:hypothetical protein N7492_001586 [Penicillium capsulatum]
MLASGRQVSHGDDFLQGLPSNIPRYKYEGQTQFLMIMDIELRRLERSLLASARKQGAAPDEADPEIKVDPQLSRHVQRGNKPQTNSRRDTRSLLKSESSDFISAHQPTDEIPDIKLPSDCVLFDIPANLLLAKMVTVIHSDIGQFVNGELTIAIHGMGLRNNFRFYARATIRGQDRGKEGDQGWGPLPAPESHPDKPTVTLEVGVSESHAKLRRDVDWWLHPDKGNANMTVTIKVDRKHPGLTIDRWERTDGVVQSTQQIDISKVNGIAQVNASLVIPFESLFLRQPTGNESDITLDQGTLRILAERTWLSQGF